LVDAGLLTGKHHRKARHRSPLAKLFDSLTHHGSHKAHGGDSGDSDKGKGKGKEEHEEDDDHHQHHHHHHHHRHQPKRRTSDFMPLHRVPSVLVGGGDSGPHPDPHPSLAELGQSPTGTHARGPALPEVTDAELTYQDYLTPREEVG